MQNDIDLKVEVVVIPTDPLEASRDHLAGRKQRIEALLDALLGGGWRLRDDRVY